MTAHVHPLTCEEVLALLSDYLDGELSPASLAAVEAHLTACDGCTRFGAQFRATVMALKTHLGRAGGSEGPRLPDRIRARLDELLADEPDPNE